MKSIKTLKNKILRKIKPKSRETGVVDDVVLQINQGLKANDLKATCVAGGSFAKDTNLEGDFDVDLFVRFDYKKFLATDKKNELSNILGDILVEMFPEVERVHGSRDYFQLTKEKFDFEIVPVLNIIDPKKSMNVTDMSPLHVDWAKKHRKGDDIRIAKSFCKAAKVYGAESYISGFSGHVLDILTIHFGSFEKLIEAVSSWDNKIKINGKIIVDINNVYKGKALEKLNKSKTFSPLIVIDPVLPERNAAAALNREKFDIFVERAKTFSKNPSESFFNKRHITKNSVEAKNKKNTLVFLNAEPINGKTDVVGAKILKVFTHMKRYLKVNEFELIDMGWEFNKDTKKAVIYFAINKKTLSKTMMRQGPPVKQGKHAEEFMKKYEITFNKKGRLFAEVLRPYRTPLPLIKDLIKSKYIKERVKKIKIT